MSFDIISAEFHRNCKALDNEDDSSALKDNCVGIAPVDRTQDVRGKRAKDDACYECDVCFTKVADLLEEC
jgi:hypothetical protein